MRIENIDWVYERLICEFDHYDICLKGLCKEDDQYYICVLHSDLHTEDSDYKVAPIDLDEECKDYLEDYKKAYIHWFRDKDGKRCHYDGRDLQWFSDKWLHRNPLVEASGIKWKERKEK